MKGRMKNKKQTKERQRKTNPLANLLAKINENEELKAFLQLGGAIQLSVSAGGLLLEQIGNFASRLI